MRMVINIWGAKQKQLGWGCGHPCADLYPSFIFWMMPPPSAGPGVLSPESLLFNLSREGNSRHQLGRKMRWESKILAVPSKRFSYFSHTCTPSFRGHRWLQFLSLKELCNTNQLTSRHYPWWHLFAFQFLSLMFLFIFPLSVFLLGLSSTPLFQWNFRRECK